MPSTPASLLERLRLPDEQAAWGRFVDLYTPLLFHWARRLGAGREEAADLIQEVFALLVVQMPKFRYEPGRRFRGWLWTLTLNKWRTRRQRVAARPQEVGGHELDRFAGEGEAPLEDSEYHQYLAGRALKLMQADFQPATWKACWESVVEGRPVAEVAAELGLTVNAVHLARSRVLRRLRQELDGLFS